RGSPTRGTSPPSARWTRSYPERGTFWGAARAEGGPRTPPPPCKTPRAAAVTAVAIRQTHELGTFREALATFVGNASDLGDPGVIKSHGVLAQQLRRLVALLDAREHEQDLVGAPQRCRRLVGARKDGDLDRAGEILHLREHHQLLLFGDVLTRAGDDAGDGHELVAGLFELREIRRHDIAHALGHPQEGVLRQVGPEQLLLPAEELALGRLRSGRERLRHDLVRHAEAREETDL